MTSPCSQFPKTAKPQTQTKQPGIESQMDPKPIYDHPEYNNGSGRLKNKVAIITGGDSGIGRAVALAFAKEGAKVVVVYYDETEDANETKQAIEQAHGECLLIQGDLTNPSFAQDIVNQTLAKFNQINILVNNAGITKDTLLMRMTEEQWDAVINVNLKSVFNFTKAVSAIMLKQKSGSIISMSSVVGVSGNAGQANYSASKAGIIGFTKSVAKELGSRNIRANAVAPGFIITDMTAQLPEDVRKEWAAKIPLRRGGTPEDIADVCTFLASDMSRYVTGQVIHVCGGMNM